MGCVPEIDSGRDGRGLDRSARNVRLALYPKQPRGPKKPKPEKQSGAKIKHVATAKVLKTRHKRT